MTISYNWLTEYIKAELTPQEIATILTSIGLEVDKLEKIEAVRGGLEGVVVGEVLTCDKHPDADKLNITTVNIGAEAPLQIVCGAPNVAAGQKVLVATVNTTLYPKDEQEGFKIKRSKIRGVESLGMICAEDELGIGESHDGILVLDSTATAGTPASKHLSLKDDYLIEIGLTPNRVDAASHYGMARDLAAYLGSHGLEGELTLPSVEKFSQDFDGRAVATEVLDQEGAPRYSGVTVSDLKIGPSPEWMQTYLRSIGINPKNNVVDITNFVLHETGQPLHAFDADKIAGGKIVVRTCDLGTKFTTLDEVERVLSPEDLMICDTDKPLTIAGVFGGLDSGVSESTTTVFIESAYFNPVRVRKTARRHGLNTDSSFRFERGADPNMTIYALKRAALLMREYAGGKISSEISDIYPDPIEDFRFDFSLDYMNRLIGKQIPHETVHRILEALGIKVEKQAGDILSVAVPPFRVDVQRQADLIEEILRIYGYNNVEVPEKVSSILTYEGKPNKDKLTNLMADMLTSNGFTEIMSNSLTKQAYYENLKSFPTENCVTILNPLSIDLNVMRQTLLFNALEAVQLNANRKNQNLKLYEFGNVYRYDHTKKEEGGLAPYSETAKLAIAITGADREGSWNVSSNPTDFFYLRGYAEKILKRFGLDVYSLKIESLDSDIFDEALSFGLNGKELMQMGVVSSELRERFDLKSEVYFLEMNFGHLINATKKHKITVSELSKYPEVKRDLALLVDKEVSFSKLREIAFQTEKKLLKSVSLFDVYQGKNLPDGKKSYALSFILEDDTKTMTDKVIDKIMSSLTTRFERECGASVRS